MNRRGFIKGAIGIVSGIVALPVILRKEKGEIPRYWDTDVLLKRYDKEYYSDLVKWTKRVESRKVIDALCGLG